MCVVAYNICVLCVCVCVCVCACVCPYCMPSLCYRIAGLLSWQHLMSAVLVVFTYSIHKMVEDSKTAESKS